MKILTIGASSLDMIMRTEALPPLGGRVSLPDHGITYQPSGAGAGCAVALAKLGANSVFCTRLGADVNGQRLHALYGECGCDTSTMVADPANPTGSTVILIERGGVREIYYPGANRHLSAENVSAAFLKSSPDALLLQMGIDEGAVLTAATCAASRKLPIILFGRVSHSFPLEKLPPVDIACFNEDEIELLTGKRPTGENTALQALLVLSRRLKANYYCIKMGNRGAFLFDGVHRQMISPYLVKVVDAAGGGEAFVATMTHLYLTKGRDISLAARYANAAAAMTLLRAGTVTAFPTKEELEAFVAHNGLQ